MKTTVLKHRFMRCVGAGLVGIAAGMATPAHAQDRADIDRTQIIGNRELPKVLYIVPWKKPLAGDLSNRPPESVLDEVMAPVDRDVFRRQMRDDNLMQSRHAAAAASPAAPAPPAGK